MLEKLETETGTDSKGAARSWPPPWLAMAALVGIVLVFYYGLWLPGLIIFKRDAYRYFVPLKQYMIERLASGELPQWFPYEGLGRPFIGTSGVGVFHPFMALYFLLPSHDAYRASILLSCLLAALGAFALGRVLNVSRTGSLTAGIAFALSGYVVSLTDNILYLYSICLLPLFCAALEKALGASRAWVVAPAIVWASVFLNGDVQTGYYYGFIALLWSGMRAPGALQKAFMRLVLIGSLAGLLAGIQLAPAAAVFIGSDRSDPEFAQQETMLWSTHPLRLLAILVAPIGDSDDPEKWRILYGDQEERAVRLAGVWASSLYLGIPVMGLALLGGWHRRGDLRVLAWLGTLALILALGRFGGLYEIFSRFVPLWSAFRYPEKMMGVVSFAVTMLAGAGVDALRAGKGRLTPWLAVAVLCAGIGLALGTNAATEWVAASFGASEAVAHEITSAAAVAFLFSTAAACGVWIIVASARRGWIGEAFLLFALAALLTLDLSRVNLEAYRTGPAELATFIPPLAVALEKREGLLAPGRFRIYVYREGLHAVPQSLKDALGDRAFGVVVRQELEVESNAPFHIESITALLPGVSKEWARFWKKSLVTPVAARFNVAYFVGHRTRVRDPRTIVGELLDYQLVLFRNPSPVKPRAYLSQRPERATSPVTYEALTARPDFLSGELDVIETAAGHLPGTANCGNVEIEHYAPEEVRVRVAAPQPAVLILLDSFDAGWKATLENGLEVPIMRANVLTRAVVVPEGAHVVTFRYQTPLLWAGAWLSFVGGVVCLLLMARACRQAHAHRSSTVSSPRSEGCR